MRKTALLLAIILVISMPLEISAAPRALGINPTLAFEGNMAACEVMVVGDNLSDHIEVTMKLMYKGYCKEKWTATGYGYVYMLEYEDIVLGSTYDLVVQVTFNGVATTPVSVTGTC